MNTPNPKPPLSHAQSWPVGERETAASPDEVLFPHSSSLITSPFLGKLAAVSSCSDLNQVESGSKIAGAAKWTGGKALQESLKITSQRIARSLARLAIATSSVRLTEWCELYHGVIVSVMSSVPDP